MKRQSGFARARCAAQSERMIPFSVLDLAPILQGGDARLAFQTSLDLARHTERLGYHRYWLAEHHNMPGIASAATSIVIAHIAAGTKTIRVGAGGIMLPNHAPLVIAEQFGTLDALYPGRIDLGLGRAPGTDPVTARALRRTLAGGVDAFPDDVAELIEYFRPAAPDQLVRAVPGAGANVDVWILGSSLFGAQLAAALGLPYAFASHFAPAQLMRAIDVYRRHFRPSDRLASPYLMLGVNIVAADTDDEARVLMTSLQQAFVNLRRGRPGPLPPPIPGFEAHLSPQERATLAEFLACSFIGSPDTVRRGLETFLARTAPDEIIITSQIHDHAARLRSYELTATIRDQLAASVPSSLESRLARSSSPPPAPSLA
jgi:luciferase family oxidoreductase group 1